MNRTKTISHLVLTVVLVMAMIVPAGALSTAGTETGVGTDLPQVESERTETDSRVNVTVGRQLSTVVSASSDEVRSTYERTAFDVAIETDDEEVRAEIIANRTSELTDRAFEIRAAYENATDAYTAGRISTSEYAGRIAVLNARATTLLESIEELETRTAVVSELELRAAGMNRTALRTAMTSLEDVTGAGPTALLKRFTGDSTGEIEIRAANGLSIDVEGEDGERAREIRRHRDDTDEITIAQSDALATATNALSAQSGRWALEESSIHPDDGYYKFEYVLRTPNGTGEAEVRVDGSSGDVFRLEEELTTHVGNADRDDDMDDEDGDIVLLVTDGTPRPGEPITIQTRIRGEPAADVTVSVNDAVVGTTDEQGSVHVTLPDRDAEITAHHGDLEGELEFEFDRDDRDRVYRHLYTDVRLDGNTVIVTVTFNGSGVANTSVITNGDHVGTTNADGMARFALETDTEELEIELVKGAFEAEYEYELRNGYFVLMESDQRHDDDSDDREADDDDREETRDEHRSDELMLDIVEGSPAPGNTVTIAITANGEPIEGVHVTLNGDRVGTTSADGTITVTFLPDEDDARIQAETDDADGELRFEFDDDAETEDDESHDDT